jgi:hypothetical protein
MGVLQGLCRRFPRYHIRTTAKSLGRQSEMTNYLKLPTWADSGHVHAVVETPRGSR